ncbi:MAG TPA: VTT domain-containing protein [Exilispira sp.]|nr:VTT domain-containing protein [Exilispira sp.]
MKKGYKTFLFIIFICLVILILIVFDFEKLSNIENIFELKEKLIQQHPLVVFLSLLGLYFLFSFLFLTIAPLSILSGIIFDKFWGAILSLIGSTITMTLSFFISRFFLNSLFNKLKEKNKKLQNIMENLTSNGKQYVLFARLFFITPYNALNLVSGISDIKTKDYIIYSILGCIPSTIFYAYSGSVLSKLKDYDSIKKNGIKLALIIGLFFLLIFLLKKIFNKKFLQNKN